MSDFKVELHDVEPKEETEAERKAYCVAISAVFPRLEKDIKRFQVGQLMYINNQSLTWDQVMISRGTFNALDLLLDHWKMAHLEHSEKGVPKEKFDKNSPLGEV